MNRKLHAVVYGRVQGVFFRARTKEYAEEMGISGTVKNLPDGTVEIVAQGENEDLERLLERLTADSGPGSIDKVEKEYSDPSESITGFRIVH